MPLQTGLLLRFRVYDEDYLTGDDTIDYLYKSLIWEGDDRPDSSLAESTWRHDYVMGQRPTDKTRSVMTTLKVIVV